MTLEGRNRLVHGVDRVTRTVALMGGALFAAVGTVPPGHVAASARSGAPAEITISSPQPYFMQLSGEGPALADNRVVWTAINLQGQAGSQADRIYAYDIAHRRLSVPVRTHYGATGFIGSYALAGSQLAYVDTGFTPGGGLVWRVCIANLATGRTQDVASLSPGASTHIAPQIAFDGTHLLMLQTVDRGATEHDSTATLFTLAQHRAKVLDRVRDRVFGDPALANNAALWTTVSFGAHASSHLTVYSTVRHTLRTVAVGNVSELAASGDLVVWKTGMSGVNGHIGLYSVHSNRVLASNLARNDRAIYPATDGHMVAWTYDDGSRVQIYSLGSGRVIYSAPVVRHRFYGLASVADHAVSWAYTVVSTAKGKTHGYVVVRQVR